MQTMLIPKIVSNSFYKISILQWDDGAFKKALEKKNSLRRSILEDILAELKTESTHSSTSDRSVGQKNCGGIDSQNQSLEQKESGSVFSSRDVSGSENGSEIEYLVGWYVVMNINLLLPLHVTSYIFCLYFCFLFCLYFYFLLPSFFTSLLLCLLVSYLACIMTSFVS